MVPRYWHYNPYGAAICLYYLVFAAFYCVVSLYGYTAVSAWQVIMPVCPPSISARWALAAS